MKLFNTLTRKKEEFVPLKAGHAGLYTCGPTVYNFAHIGNLRTYIFEDVLKRVLIHNGLAVKHVMNVTDVGHLTSDADTGEDKMEKGAAREHKSVWEIAEFYTKAFLDDIHRLNILPPDILCKATDNIKEQIALVEKLEKNGFTYSTEDGIYFDTMKLNDYGKLAKLDIEGLKAGARIDVVEGKRNPTDFALWKFSPAGSKRQMEWPSPWGVGFPGWHIECSAMSMKFLGETFDIHCGGIDHIPVHHTNEIAQAEAATGKPFVRYWMHGEFLVLNKGEKMAKSGENFLTVQTLIDKGYSALDYRYLVLGAHYHTQLMFSFEALTSAKSALQKLRERILFLKKEKSDKSTESSKLMNEYKQRFSDYINDNLDMPKAIALLWDGLKDESLSPHQKVRLAEDFDKVFGIGLASLKETAQPELPEELMQIIQQREAARKIKDYTESDRLRDVLKSKGVALMDRPEGVSWKKI